MTHVTYSFQKQRDDQELFLLVEVINRQSLWTIHSMETGAIAQFQFTDCSW